MNISRHRPYWHMDAKWICGLLLLAVVTGTLLAAGLVRLTQRERAIDISSTLMAAAFSPRGLDEEEEEMKAAQAELRRLGIMQPLPGQDVTITAEEAEGLSARELRLLIFSKIAEPLYDQRTDKLLAALSPEQREKALNDIALVSILSRENHLLLRRIFWGLLAASLALGVLLVHFSHRWGKLVSLGVVLLFASTAGALFVLLLYAVQSSEPPPIEEQEQSYPAMIGRMLSNIAPQLIDAFALPYLNPLIIGVLLLATAGAGKLFSYYRGRY